MFKVKLDKKTGFEHTLENDFNIYDFRGVLFYTSKNRKNKKIKFNVPRGTYFFDTNFLVCKPVKTKNIELPKAERIIEIDKFDFKFAENPNKATIFYRKKLIVFDNYFLKCPLPELMFTLFHELGHQYYSTERFADLYALKKMLSLGYNESQIAKAQINILSNKAIDRKNFIVEKILK